MRSFGIEENGKMDVEKLCMGCMKELKMPGICPNCGYNPAAVGTEGHYLKPYTILNGKYLVGRVLGEGGFGITYIGFDINLELPIAIKEFYPNGYVTRESDVTSLVSVYRGTNLEAISKWKSNFIREARTLAKCSHLSGIVGVKDFFEENGTAYIAMEYLEGMTLKTYAKSCGGRVEVSHLLNCLEPVMASLAKVHDSGLIHRDISPDNIMLLENGSMKLLDFGAARDYSAEDEKSLSVLLKPGYAPEEQYRTRGKQGPWSDVYAFAATIYKCITGVTPPESMERMREDDLKKPSEFGVAISPQMEAALVKGMAVYAENRYQSMSEFMDALMADSRRMMTGRPADAATGRPADAAIGRPADAAIGQPVKEKEPLAPVKQDQVTRETTGREAGDMVEKAVSFAKKYWAVIAAACVVLLIILITSGGRKEETDSAEGLETIQTEPADAEQPEQEEEEENREDPEQKAAALLEEGRTNLAEGNFGNAKQCFAEAKSLAPENAEIYLAESDLYMQEEDYMSAMSVLAEGISRTENIMLDARRNELLDSIHLTRQEKYMDDTVREICEYNADGLIQARYRYDSEGDLESWDEYVYNDGVLASEVSYYENGAKRSGIAYNEDGTENVYAAYDRSGQMTDVYIAEYAASGRLERKVYYETRGLTLNSSMDRVLRNGVKWWKIYDYDEYGNQVLDTSYNKNGSVSSWQEYYYDNAGNTVGYAAFYEDGMMNARGECSYDEEGRQTGIAEYDADGNLNRKVEYEYDSFGSCVTERRYYGNADEVSEEVEYVNVYELSENVR